MLDKWLKKFSGEVLPSFSAEHILNDTVSTTQNEALRFIAEQMQQAGYVRSATAFLEDLIAREAHDSTGFKDQVATPHAKSKQVKHAGIWVVRFTHEIPWETMDGRPVKTVVALAIPFKSNDEVMKPLIAISRANMQEAFRMTLNQGDRDEIATAIQQAIGGTV